MIRKITLLFLLCVGSFNIGMAQYSGSSAAQQRLLSTDPAYAQRFQNMTTNWVNWVNRQPNISGLVVNNGSMNVFQIPVVVHVILPGSLAANPQGTTYDPTDAQINSVITYLNQTFSTTYAGYPDSSNGGTYIPIQFVLAQRDSNCNASTGIERIDGSVVANYTLSGVNNGSGTGANEILVKNLSRWPTNQYYNIYIVNKIDGKDGTAAGVAFTSGFAYQAPAPSNVDGYVILATQVTPGNANIPLEIGHALSLFNTFEGGSVNSCPVNTNCAVDGDQVCDTQPEEESNFTCPTDPNPCTGSSYNNVQHNFMDYSSCQDRFTPGQRARMFFGLFTYRGGWLGSEGGIAPGSSPVAATCTPSITNGGNTQDAGVYEFKIADVAYNPYIGAYSTYLDQTSYGYTSDGNRAYIDRTCHQEAVLTAGTAYKFYVKAGPTATGENVAIYIDYNNDGAFSASELVYTHNGTTANEYDSATISIPTPISYPGLVTCLPLRARVISDPSGATINPCGPLVYGQAEDYTIVIKGSGSAAGSVSISLPAQADSSCTATSITFTAQPSSGVDSNTATYKWYLNGVYFGNTGKTFTTSTIADGTTVYAKLFFTNQCGTIDSANSNSIVVHRFAVLAPRVSIALTSGNNPGCPGTSLTFTATPFNGGSTAAYQWYVDGLAVGTNSNTYTSTTLTAGDSIWCILYSSSSCAYPLSVASNKIDILHYYLTATLTITATPNPACAGTPVLLQASSVNISQNSTFQWYDGATPIPGATASSYTTTALQNTDIIRCIMISPSACIINHSDTSNPVVMTIGQSLPATVGDSILVGSNPGCLDSSITFFGWTTKYIFTNYEWFVNYVPTSGGTLYSTGDTFTTNALKNGDIVTLRVNHSDAGCYSQDTLWTLPITVVLSLTPDPPVVSLIGDLLVANSDGTYAWYGPNGLIPGVAGSKYHPTTGGKYYAVRIDTGCASKSSNVVDIKLAVSSVTLNSVKIYPNPTTGIVDMDWGTRAVNVKIIVYNAAGQGVLYDAVNNQTKKTLDLSAMPSGNYYIMLRDEEGLVTTKMITVTGS